MDSLHHHADHVHHFATVCSYNNTIRIHPALQVSHISKSIEKKCILISQHGSNCSATLVCWTSTLITAEALLHENLLSESFQSLLKMALHYSERPIHAPPDLSTALKSCSWNSTNAVWLNTGWSWPQRVEHWLLFFSTPLSFWRSVMWCSGLFMLRTFLKP